MAEKTLEQFIADLSEELAGLSQESGISITIIDYATKKKKVKCYILRGENPPVMIQVPCDSYHDGELTID